MRPLLRGGRTAESPPCASRGASRGLGTIAWRALGCDLPAVPAALCLRTPRPVGGLARQPHARAHARLTRWGARGRVEPWARRGSVGSQKTRETKELKDSRPPIFRATDCSPTSHVARARPRPSAGGRGVSEHCHRQGGVTHGRALGVCIPSLFPPFNVLDAHGAPLCLRSGRGGWAIGPNIQRKSIHIRRHLLLLATSTLLFTHARAPRERGKGGEKSWWPGGDRQHPPHHAHPPHLACDSVRRRPYRPQRGEGARGRRVKWGSSR